MSQRSELFLRQKLNFMLSVSVVCLRVMILWIADFPETVILWRCFSSVLSRNAVSKKEKSVSHRDVILSYFSAQSAQPNLQQEKNSASRPSLVDKTKNALSKIKQFPSVSKG